MRTDRRATATLTIAAVWAGIGGALSGASPSGHRLADALMAAGFAVIVTLAGASAARRHAFIGGCTAGVAAQGLLRLPHVGPHGRSALAVAVLTTPLLVAGYRAASTATRARIHKAVLGGGAAILVLVAAYGIAAATARTKLERGLDRLDKGIAAARQGDDKAVATHLDVAAKSLSQAERDLTQWWATPADVLPVIGHNARAIRGLTADAVAVARFGGQAAQQADPKSLALRQGQLDVHQLRTLSGPLEALLSAMDQTASTIRGIDSPWLAAPVADRVESADAKITGARGDAELVRDAVQMLPTILGADQPTRWFVAFVTPVEARGRTGFMGNWAELTISNGHLEMTRFGRTSELEEQGVPPDQRILQAPDDYLGRWGRFLPASDWRNLSLSPDFPSVAQAISSLYPQSGGQPIDGVMSLDPYALAALLKLTGPIEVEGIPEPLTAEKAASFLLQDQYVQFPEQEDRVDVLSLVGRTTFERLTSAQLPGPRQLADVLGDAARGGHIQLHSVHPDQQRLFERTGLDGALPPVNGDSLAVVNNNAGGNKIDMFLSRQLDYQARWSPTTGDIAATLTVTMTNSAPTEGPPDYVIGGALGSDELPKGTNRTYLSIYSPLELSQMTVDGVPVHVESQRERDRWAYSVFLDLPGEGGQRTVTLDLRGTLEKRGGYRLDVAAQPQMNPDHLDLSVDAVSPTGTRRTLSRSEALVNALSSYRLETLHSS